MCSDIRKFSNHCFDMLCRVLEQDVGKIFISVKNFPYELVDKYVFEFLDFFKGILRENNKNTRLCNILQSLITRKRPTLSCLRFIYEFIL